MAFQDFGVCSGDKQILNRIIDDNRHVHVSRIYLPCNIMRVVLYSSGILGVTMFALGIIGSLVGYPGSELIMFTGIAFFVILFLPLLVFQKYRQERTNKEVIESGYKVKNSKTEKQDNAKSEGWGVNDSPFREPKIKT